MLNMISTPGWGSSLSDLRQDLMKKDDQTFLEQEENEVQMPESILKESIDMAAKKEATIS